MKKICFVISLAIALLAAKKSHAADAFYYTSSATSWIGQGNTETITPSDDFTFSASAVGRSGYWPYPYAPTVAIGIKNDSPTDYENWELWFEDTSGQGPIMHTGLYPDVERWPFVFDVGYDGLSFDGNGREDNTLSGQFNVLQISVSVSNGTTYIDQFAADFIQYDEGDPAAWNIGSIRYNSDIPLTIVPESSTLALLALGAVGLLARRLFAGFVIHR